ncbi:unnamed protein product [Meloidogyne enterolobii]|uniref:Uncharacterized protein n=1 Tax=Meloidogyne enterolobii TaxID=390850 RepID=A0ACB1A4V7_MELEN
MLYCLELITQGHDHIFRTCFTTPLLLWLKYVNLKTPPSCSLLRVIRAGLKRKEIYFIKIRKALTDLISFLVYMKTN